MIEQVPQGTHNHCKAPSCYNRLQFITECSRCNGPTTPCRGAKDGCVYRLPGAPQPDFVTPTSVDEADKLMEELR